MLAQLYSVTHLTIHMHTCTRAHARRRITHAHTHEQSTNHISLRNSPRCYTKSRTVQDVHARTHMYALTLNEPHLQKQFYTCMNNRWSTSPLKIGLDVMQSHPLHARCWWVGSSVKPLANYLQIHPITLHAPQYNINVWWDNNTILGSHSPIPHRSVQVALTDGHGNFTTSILI